jgi:hypothetical protein
LKKEKGMYKADICRVAELYLNGGYYFDVDLLAVHSVSPADSVRFATVRGQGWPKHGFFQAFTARAPGHPILKKVLGFSSGSLHGQAETERVDRAGNDADRLRNVPDRNVTGGGFPRSSVVG